MVAKQVQTMSRVPLVFGKLTYATVVGGKVQFVAAVVIAMLWAVASHVLRHERLLKLV